jgi:hypothetical protein
MLRLWQAGRDHDNRAWRAALESPHTGERHVFTSLADLFAFLAARTEQPTPTDSNSRP